MFARHERLAEATRRAVRAWGLDIWCHDPKSYSPAVTAVGMPEGHNADAFRKIVLDNFDMSLGTGLNKLAGKAFRIGHLGHTNELTICGALCGVEMGLQLAGVPAREGRRCCGDGLPRRDGAAREGEGCLTAGRFWSQREKPAEASSIWHFLPSWKNFEATQLLTLATVGDGPRHRRRTSPSQAARSCGVTSGGSFSSSAFATKLADTSASTTTAVKRFILVPLCLLELNERHHHAVGAE